MEAAQQQHPRGADAHRPEAGTAQEGQAMPSPSHQPSLHICLDCSGLGGEGSDRTLEGALGGRRTRVHLQEGHFSPEKRRPFPGESSLLAICEADPGAAREAQPSVGKPLKCLQRLKVLSGPQAGGWPPGGGDRDPDGSLSDADQEPKWTRVWA